MTLTCSVAFEKIPHTVWPVQPPETPVVACAQARTLKTRKRGRSKGRVKTATPKASSTSYTKCFLNNQISWSASGACDRF